ncbi:MAG: hypothetical protein ACFFDI_09480 [Promethearchaeota archaeon]
MRKQFRYDSSKVLKEISRVSRKYIGINEPFQVVKIPREAKFKIDKAMNDFSNLIGLKMNPFTPDIWKEKLSEVGELYTMFSVISQSVSSGVPPQIWKLFFFIKKKHRLTLDICLLEARNR